MWADEVLYKTTLFGKDYNSSGVSGYDNVSWYSTTNGFRANIVNANNNNTTKGSSNNWTYIKVGGKNGAYTGTITTNAAIDKAITKVTMTIDAITAGNVTSMTLYTSSNGTSWTSVGTFDKTTGAKEVELTSPTSNLYYKIEIVCTQGSSNGLVTISRIDYYYASAPSHTLGSAVDPVSTGTVTLGATSIEEGSTTTISATPADGYRFVEWGVSGSGSSVASTTSASTTFTMGTEDATVTANFEAIPTHTLSSAVTPSASGTVTLGSTTVAEGSTTTATAAAAAGYKFKSWSISGTGASLSSTSTNPTTVTMGTADATVTATFEAVTTYAIKWSVNGNVVQTDNVEENTAITFPSSISGIPSGYAFRGWSASEILTPQATEAGVSYVTSATSTADITYYAVMAIEVGVSAPTLTKMVKGDTFVAGDKIVIVANGTNYGLYQETTNSSYVKNFSFDGEVESIAADDKTWLTVTAGSNEKWILGDATNGYLYSSGSNNLAVNTSNSSQWTLEDNDDGTFSLTQGRYLSCRSDLSDTNKYLYRLAGSTPGGIYVFDIYKYVLGSPIYSNYCTTVLTATATITKAEYATFVSPYATDFSTTGITVYTATDNTTYVKLNEVAGGQVPANTPVVLYKAGADGSAIDVPVIASADPVASNDLSVVGAGGLSDEDGVYVLAKKANGVGFYLWDKSKTLNEGKVCLRTGGSSAREFLSFDEGETTSLREIRNEELGMKNAEYFNLNGQRVAQPTKGLYIVNGRKVVIK